MAALRAAAGPACSGWVGSPAPGCGPTSPCAGASTSRWCWAAAPRSPSPGSAGTRAARSRPATACRSAIATTERVPSAIPPECWPAIDRRWRIGVLEGPHGAPSFFTPGDIDELFAATWRVQVHCARSGVRLDGPKPTWARPDGGEAGLHPSNIHDTGYAFGTIDFTGDTPVVLGPDGPSLGGFTCPATVVAAERWKLGQLAPGDEVVFVPLSPDRAGELARPRRGHRRHAAGRRHGADAHRPPRSRAAGCSCGSRPRAIGRRSPSAAAATPSCSSSTARCRSTSRCGPGSTPSTAGWPTRRPTRSSTSRPASARCSCSTGPTS